MDEKLEFIKNRFLSLLSKNRPEWMPSRSSLRATGKKSKNKNHPSKFSVRSSIFSKIRNKFGFPGMNTIFPAETFGGGNNSISYPRNNSELGINSTTDLNMFQIPEESQNKLEPKKLSKLNFDEEAEVYSIYKPYRLNNSQQPTNMNLIELNKPKNNSKKSENNINKIKLKQKPKEDLIEDMDNYVDFIDSKIEKSNKNKKDNIIKKTKKSFFKKNLNSLKNNKKSLPDQNNKIYDQIQNGNEDSNQNQENMKFKRASFSKKVKNENKL